MDFIVLWIALYYSEIVTFVHYFFFWMQIFDTPLNIA